MAIVCIAYLIGELGGLIPVPGGIGGVDAGLVGTLALYNVPIAHAASAVLAYRAIALWLPALLAAPALVSLRRELNDSPARHAGDMLTTRFAGRSIARAHAAERDAGRDSRADRAPSEAGRAPGSSRLRARADERTREQLSTLKERALQAEPSSALCAPAA